MFQPIETIASSQLDGNAKHRCDVTYLCIRSARARAHLVLCYTGAVSSFASRVIRYVDAHANRSVWREDTRNCSDLWEGHGTVNEWNRQQDASRQIIAKKLERRSRNFLREIIVDNSVFFFLIILHTYTYNMFICIDISVILGKIRIKRFYERRKTIYKAF